MNDPRADTSPVPVKGARGRAASAVLTAILACYAVAIIGQIAVKTDVYQFNFRTYYYVSKAFSEGLDPYDMRVLSEAAGGRFVQNLGYPPLMLNVLRPLCLFDYAIAYRGYLLLKCLALVLLLWLWHRKFLDSGVDNVFLLVCLIGFSYALDFDLQSGNISLFTQTILWIGFCAYTQGRLGWFVLCTIAASAFKMTPIVFLALLLLVEDRKKWMWLAVGGVSFGLLQLTSVLLYPGLTASMLNHMREAAVLVPIGGQDVNLPNFPAAWPFIKAVLARTGEKAGIHFPTGLPVVIFLGYALAVTGITAFAAWCSTETDPRQRRIQQVSVACLLYLLVMPRLNMYDYVVGLLPAYYVIKRLGQVNAVLLLMAMMLPAPTSFLPPGIRLLVETGQNYYPLFVAGALWALCVHHFWSCRLSTITIDKSTESAYSCTS